MDDAVAQWIGFEEACDRYRRARYGDEFVDGIPDRVNWILGCVLTPNEFDRLGFEEGPFERPPIVQAHAAIAAAEAQAAVQRLLLFRRQVIAFSRWTEEHAIPRNADDDLDRAAYERALAGSFPATRTAAPPSTGRGNRPLPDERLVDAVIAEQAASGASWSAAARVILDREPVPGGGTPLAKEKRLASKAKKKADRGSSWRARS